jgi:fumarate hydratase class II
MPRASVPSTRVAPQESNHVKRIKDHLDNSLMLVTALNPHIGYEKPRSFASRFP